VLNQVTLLVKGKGEMMDNKKAYEEAAGNRGTKPGGSEAG